MTNEVKKVEVTPDELKLIMAYRYREELAAGENLLIRLISDMHALSTLSPDQVRELCSAATSYDVLLTKCGYLPELEAEDQEDDEHEVIEKG